MIVVIGKIGASNNSIFKISLELINQSLTLLFIHVHLAFKQMEKNINFSGLGFEIGQMHRGLTTSPMAARNYFSILKNAGLNLKDCGDLIQDETKKEKFFSVADFEKGHWDKYHQAFMKTLALLEEESPLINWGGDHSMALSSVSAFTHCYQNGFVIWIDAHADLNIPAKSLTGNLHGMPLAVLLNLENIASYYFKWIAKYLDPNKLIYVGLRDLDPFEKNIISELGIKSFSFEDIQKLGIDYVTNDIIKTVKHHPVHVSFDIDSVDPLFAPSTGVPVVKGLSPDDLDFLGSHFFQHLNVRSVDVVEINPSLGTILDVDQTYITAFNFLKSIFTQHKSGDHYESMGTRDQAKRFIEMDWGL